MITEDYVSFETAKLLNEKGFDEETNGWLIRLLPTLKSRKSSKK